MLIASLVLRPEGIAAWLVAGLAIGWLAGKMLEPPSYGAIGDLILGVLGAMAGAAVGSLFVSGEPEFWLPIVTAVLGACLLIGVVRFVVARRNA